MTRTTIRVDDSIFAYFEKEDGNRSDLTRFGTVIEFEEGKQFASVKFLGQDQPVIIPSAWIQQRALRAHQCAPEACLADWTCRPGHFGRLCGLCIDSYVMSTEGCVPCAVSQDDIWKVTTGCVVISLLLWYVTSWRHWLRCTDAQEVWIARRFQALSNFSIGMLVFLLNKIKTRAGREQAIRTRIKRLMKVDEGVGYAKLVIGYYQVTAGFLSNFGIDWPDMMETVLSAMNFLTFDILNLPSVACILKHHSYETKLQISTMVSS